MAPAIVYLFAKSHKPETTREVYYEPVRRPVVESALAQQGFPVATMKDCGFRFTVLRV